MKKIMGIVTLTILLLNGCKGVGIFAYIAVTDKIDLGLLPEGIGTSAVFQIYNEVKTSEYNYFSSGGALYRRNIADRSESTTNRWSSLSLPSGWTNIQSIAVSNDKLLLALANSSAGSMSVSLYYYTEAAQFEKITTDILDSSASAFKTVMLYSPNPADTGDVFYVNVLEYSGVFGKETDFKGSSLHLLNNAGRISPATGNWETALEKSYISGAAYDGSSTYRFSLINPDDETGMLTDENGDAITGMITDASGNITNTPPDLPCHALSWMPDDGTSKTAAVFIMSSWKLEGSDYPLYISKDGSNWNSLKSSYRFACFLDVRSTEAGGDPDGSYDAPDDLILAGTRNFNATSNGSGYMEIVATDTEPANWTIRTDKNSFTLAKTNTYIASNLSGDSIVGLTLLDGYVYASTDDDGLWRINADDEAKHKNNNLEWARE